MRTARGIVNHPACIEFNYAGQEVRTVEDADGEPRFVAADVCAVLEHTNPSMAVAALDEDERGLSIVETPGGLQQMVTVSESGLYSLILRSRKPEARTFKRWVTHEVLPAIRKTGRYEVVPALPKSYAEALRELASTVEERDAAQAKVAELEPAAEAWDDLVDTGTTLDVAAAAKKLVENGIVIGRTRLYAYMREIGWVFKHSTQPTQSAVDTGWVTVDWGKQYTNSKTGEQGQGEAKTRVTAKGLAELRRRLSVPQIGAAS